MSGGFKCRPISVQRHVEIEANVVVYECTIMLPCNRKHDAHLTIQIGTCALAYSTHSEVNFHCVVNRACDNLEHMPAVRCM